MILEKIVKNPFRLLGVPVNSKLSEINKSINKITAYAKVKKTYQTEFDIGFLSFENFSLDQNGVEQLKRGLDLDVDKIKFSLYWFIEANKFDSIGLSHIKNNNITKTLEIWRKIVSKSISKNNFSTYNNLSSLLLLKNIDKSSNDYKFNKNVEADKEISEAISIKTKLLESNFHTDLFESITKTPKIFSNEEIIRYFTESISKMLEVNRSKIQIEKLFSSLDPKLTEKLNKEKSNSLISSISTQIKNCRALRNQEPKEETEVFDLTWNSSDLAPIAGTGSLRESKTYELKNKILAEDVVVKPSFGRRDSVGRVIVKKGTKLTKFQLDKILSSSFNGDVVVFKDKEDQSSRFLNYGNSLMNNTKESISELKRVLGKSSAQYKKYCNELATELNICGKQLLDESGDNSEFVPIYNFSLLVCEDKDLKKQIQSNLNVAKAIQKTAGASEMYKLIKDYENGDYKKNLKLSQTNMLKVSVIKNHPLKLAYFFFEECGVILNKINKQIQTASTTRIDPENNIRSLYLDICSKLTQLILNDIIAHSNDQLDALNRAIAAANQINNLGGQFGGGIGFGRDIIQSAVNKMKERVNDLKIVDKLLKRLENLELDSVISERLISNAEILRKNLRQSTSEVRKIEPYWQPSIWPPGIRTGRGPRPPRPPRPPVPPRPPRRHKPSWWEGIFNELAESGCLGQLIWWGGIALFVTLMGSC